MDDMKRLDNDTFSTVIENTPLVSIDLVTVARDGRALLGRRKNEPARDSWFVYGGRIYKNETIAAATDRISRAELQMALEYDAAAFLGVFEHLYDRNVFEKDSFGTHYVVLAYRYVIDDDVPVIADSQHHDHRWWTIPDLLASPDVHPYTKAYFTS